MIEFRLPATTVFQDWSGLQRYLETQGLHLNLQYTPRQFAGGFGNLNYCVEINGNIAVLRRPPPGLIPPGANDMAREFRVLSKLWRGYAPAPRCLHFCSDAAILGAPFLLIEYRPGLIIRGKLPDHLVHQKDIGSTLTNLLVELLAELHAVDPTAIGLGDFGRPEGFLERTLHGWRKRAEIAASDVSLNLTHDLVNWLTDHIVPDQEPSLLHGDFKLDNVILDLTGGRVIAVIDWDLATRGDPLFDLATMLSYWPQPNDPAVMHQLGQMPSAGHQFPRREDVVQKYAAVTGRNISNFLFYRVLAMFRLGIVFLQLYNRNKQGALVDQRFSNFNILGLNLLEFAHEISAGRAF
jgi:aminoglycoside phosphotransferase (APT) family kinase protein